MIDKKRLEELIEQGATIYSNEYGEIQLKKENNLILYENGQNNYILYALKPNKKYHNEIFDEDLFETEEEAKWFAEFGCIERTEKLELPTWEEFSKWDKSIKFCNNSTKYSMYVFVKNKNTKNCRIIIYADNGEQDWLVFEQPLTQENYTLACRKCKELFLGEKK